MNRDHRRLALFTIRPRIAMHAHYGGTGDSIVAEARANVPFPAPPDEARENPPDPETDIQVIYDGIDHPLWVVRGNKTELYELDTTGNVRHRHAGQQFSFDYQDGNDPNYTGDLGGYAYSAFGKRLAPSDVGGLEPPTSFSPFTWQGKRELAPNLYYSRARIWSADLGTFLQPDQYAYLSRGGTLWSWPGQNPFRWRDPSGRIGGDGASTDRAIGSPQDWGDPWFRRGLWTGGAIGAELHLAALLPALVGGAEVGFGQLAMRALASPSASIRNIGVAAWTGAQTVKGCASDGMFGGSSGSSSAARGAAVLGRGSTASLAKGTTLARNLRESLAIEQAMANPTAGRELALKMTDPRWPASEGWLKMQQVIQSGGREGATNVHYLLNKASGAIDDFKIVLQGAR